MSNDGIAGVQQAKEEIREYLKTELHLELSEEKTLLTHLNNGFDFLGFHIQRVKPEGRWVVHLRPAEKSKERIKRKLKDFTSRGWTWMDEYTRLNNLNVVVRGWAQYTSTPACSLTSKKLPDMRGSDTSIGSFGNIKAVGKTT